MEISEEDKVRELFDDSRWYDETEKFVLRHGEGSLDDLLIEYRDTVTSFVQDNSFFDKQNSKEIAETILKDVYDCAFDTAD